MTRKRVEDAPWSMKPMRDGMGTKEVRDGMEIEVVYC